jgi:hypothetical protein
MKNMNWVKKRIEGKQELGKTGIGGKQELSENTNATVQDGWSPGQDSRPGSPDLGIKHTTHYRANADTEYVKLAVLRLTSFRETVGFNFCGNTVPSESL